MTNGIPLSPLRRWMRKNNLNMNEMAVILGCHRQTLRSMCDGEAVEEALALKVYFVTNGAVNPEVKRRGRPTANIPTPATKNDI